MATTSLKLLIVAIATSIILEAAEARNIHVVGGRLGWQVPGGGPFAYGTWSALQTFNVGDILVFNFTSGKGDVARVEEEAYHTCNSKNPVALKEDGPANFTLDKEGDYFFISSKKWHCLLGQKLAIRVRASRPSLPPPRGPMTYTVGDNIGWLIPPGGATAYTIWAHNKTFIVGDTLVFNFINGKQDVKEVTKHAYEACNMTSTDGAFTVSPVKILLNSTGEHLFTSTFRLHCALGQKLAINVTAPTITASPPSGGKAPPSNSTGPSPGEPEPSPAVNSTPSHFLGIFFLSLLSMLISLF